MFLARFIGLLAWLGISLGFGMLPRSSLNGFGEIAGLSFYLAAIVLYFYPMYEAYIQKQPNFYSIFTINLFLGWTLVGWVVALVWALKVHPGSEDYQPEVVRTVTDESVKANVGSMPSEAKRLTVECPFCAEEILAKAKKCKHCGSDVEPQQV